MPLIVASSAALRRLLSASEASSASSSIAEDADDVDAAAAALEAGMGATVVLGRLKEEPLRPSDPMMI